LTADSATLNSALSVGSNGVFNVDSSGAAGGRLTVLGNGNVGINQPNPGASLDVSGNVNISNGSSGTTTVTGYMTTVNGYMNLCPAPDASQGTIAVGGSGSWNSMLTVGNNRENGLGITVFSSGSTNTGIGLSVLGVCGNTSGSWIQLSDLSLKDGVEPYTDSLAQLLKINPIRYHYKEKAGLGAAKYVGIAAQDLQQIAPYMVGKGRLDPNNEEEYLTMDNGPLTYMLINAVKDLHAEMEAQKTELKALKTELKTLQGK
jgi:hypothetical protein